jgi:hypothetical protein
MVDMRVVAPLRLLDLGAAPTRLLGRHEFRVREQPFESCEPVAVVGVAEIRIARRLRAADLLRQRRGPLGPGRRHPHRGARPRARRPPPPRARRRRGPAGVARDARRQGLEGGQAHARGLEVGLPEVGMETASRAGRLVRPVVRAPSKRTVIEWRRLLAAGRRRWCPVSVGRRAWATDGAGACRGR